MPFFGRDDALFTLVSTSALLWAKQGRSLRCTVQRTLAFLSSNGSRPVRTAVTSDAVAPDATAFLPPERTTGRRVPMTAHDHRLRLLRLLQRFDRPEYATETAGDEADRYRQHDTCSYPHRDPVKHAGADDASALSVEGSSSRTAHGRGSDVCRASHSGTPVHLGTGSYAGRVGLRLSKAYHSSPSVLPSRGASSACAAGFGARGVCEPSAHGAQSACTPHDSARYRHGMPTPSVLSCRRHTVHVTLLTQYDAEDVTRVAHRYTRAEIQILFAAMAKDGLWQSVIRVSRGLDAAKLTLTHLTQINVEAGLRTLLSHAPSHALAVSYYFAYAVDMLLAEDILVALFDACRYDVAAGLALYRHLRPFQTRWSATVYACCLTLTARDCPDEALRLYEDYARLPPACQGRATRSNTVETARCGDEGGPCWYKHGNTPDSLGVRAMRCGASAHTGDAAGDRRSHANWASRDGQSPCWNICHDGVCTLQHVYHIMVPLAMQHAPERVARYMDDMLRHDPDATPDVLLKCLTLPPGPTLACRYLHLAVPTEQERMNDAELVSVAVALYQCKPSTMNMNTLLAILILAHKRSGVALSTTFAMIDNMSRPICCHGNHRNNNPDVGSHGKDGTSDSIDPGTPHDGARGNRDETSSSGVHEERHAGCSPSVLHAGAASPTTRSAPTASMTSLFARLARARSCAQTPWPASSLPHTSATPCAPVTRDTHRTAVTLGTLLREMPLPSLIDVVILCRTLVEQEAPWETIAEPFLYAVLRRKPRELATVLPPLLVTLAMQQGAWAAAARIMTIYLSNQRGVMTSADVSICVEASVKAGLWSQALFWMTRAQERQLPLSHGTHRYIADARQKLMHESGGQGTGKKISRGGRDGLCERDVCAGAARTSHVIYGSKARDICTPLFR